MEKIHWPEEIKLGRRVARKGVYAHGEWGLQELYPSIALSWAVPIRTVGLSGHDRSFLDLTDLVP